MPAIATVDVNAKIDKKGLDIKLDGNIWTTLASWFEWFFTSTICNEIESQIKDQITNTLPPLVNKLIVASDGYATPVPFEKMTEFLTVDFSQFAPVAISTTTIEAGINGFVFDNRYAKSPVPGVVSVPMPTHDSTQPEQVQAFANTFFVNNLFAELIQENQDFTVTLDSTNTGFNMTTSSLNYALLGIKKFYGPDLPITIDAQLKQIHDFRVREADETMEALSSVNLKFYVHTPEKIDLAVDLDVVDIKTNFTVIIDEMTLSGNITALNVQDITDNYCSWGSVHVDLLRKLIDDILDPTTDVIETLNAFLGKNARLQVPDQFGGVFKLSQLTLKYHDDFVFVGLTPTFIAPPKGQEVEIFPTLTTPTFSWKQGVKAEVAEVAASIGLDSEEIAHDIEEAKEVAEVVEKGINGLENIISIIRKHHLQMEKASA